MKNLQSSPSKPVSAASSLPSQLVITDIEAPTLPDDREDGENDEDEDGCLLSSFTVTTDFCASGLTNIRNRWLECGAYLRGAFFFVPHSSSYVGKRVMKEWEGKVPVS